MTEKVGFVMNQEHCVTPAQAGVQKPQNNGQRDGRAAAPSHWIPAFAGMTQRVKFSPLQARSHRRP